MLSQMIAIPQAFIIRRINEVMLIVLTVQHNTKKNAPYTLSYGAFMYLIHMVCSSEPDLSVDLPSFGRKRSAMAEMAPSPVTLQAVPKLSWAR